MWVSQSDSKLAAQEKNFQKMLVNNMEQVFKIFFRNMNTIRVKVNKADPSGDETHLPVQRLDLDLESLEERGTVATRVRADTKVKQYHAGQIFDYLQRNIVLNSNQCLLVLTNADLYPKDGWTFVFGMTKQSWRICIQSYARHHPNFGKDATPTRSFNSKVAR